MTTTPPQISLATERINAAMEDQGVSIKDLALALGITYEHARKVVRGLVIPHGLLLREICSVLALDHAELLKLVNTADIMKKYGSLPAEIAGKNPELQIIERAWASLSAAQKQDLNTQAVTWAKRNRALGLIDGASS
jgi:transcriptional regulator with XRE-family HTH domain